jgi:hypothetical protein
MPLTRFNSSTRWKGRLVDRYLLIRFERAGPTPGRAWRASDDAVFTLIGFSAEGVGGAFDA